MLLNTLNNLQKKRKERKTFMQSQQYLLPACLTSLHFSISHYNFSWNIVFRYCCNPGRHHSTRLSTAAGSLSSIKHAKDAPRRRATYKCSECEYTYIYISIYIHIQHSHFRWLEKSVCQHPTMITAATTMTSWGSGGQPVSDVAYFHTSGLISYCKQNGRQTCFRHGAVAPACLPLSE